MTKTKFEVDKDKLQVRITRLFNARPEQLWKAFSDPELIAKWWSNTTVDKHEFKVGGQWRYIDHGKNNDEQHAFRGEFKQLDEPHMIVRTFEYELWAGHILTESVNFEAQADGQTLMVNVSKYPSLKDLEGMVASGMERGATAGLERLAKIVETKE